jgi:hypothetical protein
MADAPITEAELRAAVDFLTALGAAGRVKDSTLRNSGSKRCQPASPVTRCGKPCAGSVVSQAGRTPKAG